jgi:hypothetical protein
MEFLTFLGYLLLRRAILLVVICGGLLYAVMQWKRHPRVSLLTTIGLGFYLIESWFFAFLFHYLPRWFETVRLTSENISVLDSTLQLLDDFAFAAVLILLVAAAFSQRKVGTVSG